jgi:hypothetical protein
VVLRIFPLSPTAVPVFASVNETPLKGYVVPLDCEVHVVPPSVVLRIVPPSPTAHPIVDETKSAEVRKLPCGNGFCQNHCAKQICGTSKNKNKVCIKVFIKPPMFFTLTKSSS